MNKHSVMNEVKDWVKSIALAIALAFLIHYFIIEPYKVEGPSMLPTLVQDDRVMVNKFVYRLHPPQRGDIIVFQYPLDPDRDFIKRVIAVGGDTIQVNNGQVLVNGQQLTEPYILEPTNGSYPLKAVPEGHYFVMGDDRNNSEDSRFSVGFLPSQFVKGKAMAIFWPLQKIANL
ncbi:MAG: signal peptidase I [Veillonellales bacterium]